MQVPGTAVTNSMVSIREPLPWLFPRETVENVNYLKSSSALVSTRNIFQDLPRLSETADNTESYM
jgi:hypothetical protein